MRFGKTHRGMINALAALGLLAIAVSLPLAASIALLVGFAIALLVNEPLAPHPWLRRAGAAVLILILAVLVLGSLRAPLLLLVEVAAALQLARLATRKGAAHDQQIIALALIHLLAGAALGGGIGYGLCLFGVLVVTPGALLLSHLRREVEGNYRQGARDRTGHPVDVPRILRSRRVVGPGLLAATCLLAIPIALCTALIFLISPRGGPWTFPLFLKLADDRIGFSGHLDLGAGGPLRADPTLVGRVRPPPSSAPPPRVALHLRGMAFDVYDGRVWSQSQVARRRIESTDDVIQIARAPDPARDPVMRIDLEPIDPPVIFLPAGAKGIRPGAQDRGAAIFAGPEGELRYSPQGDRGFGYDVLLGMAAPSDLTEGDRARYLALPAGLPARVKALARAWTAAAETPQDRARAIEAHLRAEYRYDLTSPSAASPAPLDHFLFASKRGNCQFYSTAMAIMLRAVGVPSREVSGFLGGAWNRFGRFYAVRQADAHAWVEVYLDDGGWTMFDPTPAAEPALIGGIGGAFGKVRDMMESAGESWDLHVTWYDRGRQESLLATVTEGARGASSGLVAAALLLAASGGAMLLVRRVRRRRERDGAIDRSLREAPSPAAAGAIELYGMLETAMSAHGIPRARGTPPLRHAEVVASMHHPLAPEILELTCIYLGSRFGGAPLSAEVRRDFQRRVRGLGGLGGA